MAIDNVLEAFGSHIVGTGGGGRSGTGGHTIVDQDGNDMASEDDLQFADAFVSDDSTNGRTVIENIKECLSTDIANMGDGLFHTTDEEDVPIGDIEEDYVSVTADGEKNLSVLLDELHALIDTTKISGRSYLYFNDAIFNYQFKAANDLCFSFTLIDGNTVNVQGYILRTSSSGAYVYDGTTISPYATTNIPTRGTKITLYYGTSSSIINLLTNADSCMLDTNTSVKQAITRTESNIAPIESSTASQAYAVGDQFILNGLLYKATAAINQGGTIVPNGNCSLSDSLVKQIDKGYIRVIADGEKTYSQLLDEIYSSMIASKVSKSACFRDNQAYNPLSMLSPSSARFGSVINSGTSVVMRIYCLQTSGSTFLECAISSNSTVSYVNNSTQKPANGSTLSLYY